MATEFNSEFVTYFTPDGVPSEGDKFKFYEPGTLTSKPVYSDNTLSTAIGNELAVDARGNLPKAWLDGTYRVRRFDKNDVLIKDSDPVGASPASGYGSDWSSTVSYNTGEVSRGSDGNYYISLTNSNVGNDPTISAANWTQITIMYVWNASQTYAMGEVVQTSDGKLWRSIINGNIGNDPSTDSGSNWRIATGAGWINIAENITTGGNTIIFTNIPSGTVEIEIYFNGWSTDTGTGVAAIEIGDSGGIETTGYTSSVVNSVTFANVSVFYQTNIQLDAAVTYRGYAKLAKISGDKWSCNSVMVDTNLGAEHTQSGFKTLSDELDRVQFRITSGNFDVNDGIWIRYR